MGTEGNNMRGDYAHLRDTFFGAKNFSISNRNIEGTGEAEYLREILSSSPRARQMLRELINAPADALYKAAQERIDMIENLQVKPEDLEQVEAEIALLLAAIDDMHLVKTLELTPDYETEKERNEAYMKAERERNEKRRKLEERKKEEEEEAERIRRKKKQQEEQEEDERIRRKKKKEQEKEEEGYGQEL